MNNWIENVWLRFPIARGRAQPYKKKYKKKQKNLTVLIDRLNLIACFFFLFKSDLITI